MKTSYDIQPGPFSEQDLRQRWNDQADQFNQWDSLDSCEQLAWAQTQAVATDRAENQRRLYRLQQENNRFREPESTILCDLLANGQLLPDPYGKRYGLKVDPTRAALERLIEAIEGIELKGVPEVDDAIAAARTALANAEPAPTGKDPLQVAPPVPTETVMVASVVKDSLATAPPTKEEPSNSKAQTITVQAPSFEEMRDWILREGQFSPCGTELLQCLMLMTPPAPPAGEEAAELVEWLAMLRDRSAGLARDCYNSNLSRIIALLQQRHPAPVAVSEREAGAIEALRRIRRWGNLSGGGYSADVVLGVVDWIDGGMTGPLPPLPAHALPMPAEEGS